MLMRFSKFDIPLYHYLNKMQGPKYGYWVCIRWTVFISDNEILDDISGVYQAIYRSSQLIFRAMIKY